MNAKSEDRLNETDVDRVLEEISGRFLRGETSDDDMVKYQRLLAWRRENLFKLPSHRARRSFAKKLAS